MTYVNPFESQTQLRSHHLLFLSVMEIGFIASMLLCSATISLRSICTFSYDQTCLKAVKLRWTYRYNQRKGTACVILDNCVYDLAQLLYILYSLKPWDLPNLQYKIDGEYSMQCGKDAWSALVSYCSLSNYVQQFMNAFISYFVQLLKVQSIPSVGFTVRQLRLWKIAVHC